MSRQIEAAVDDRAALTQSRAQMLGRKRKWRLVDLVDFEARLLEGEAEESAALRRRYREQVGALGGWPRAEAEKRRVGLRAWLEAGRLVEAEEGPGQRMVAGVRLAGMVLGMVAFLVGIGVVNGLVQRPDLDLVRQGYNVWLFLGVALGVQWLLLLGGLVGYCVVRRGRGTLSLFQRAASWLALRVAGVGGRSLTKRLLEGGAGYRSVFSWRLARLTQGAAACLNLGLLVGFYGSLSFRSVRFFWESTLEGSGWGLIDLTEAMAAPWSWSGVALPPGRDEVGYSVIAKLWYEQADVNLMWPFLMMSLAVYGLLPRALLWALCAVKERRALATIPFHAPRHRELWRRLTRVERTLASKGQADGVVLLDVGGTEVPTEALREFLLRELRVNPQARFAAAVFEAEREEEALAAIEAADLGVVLLVEGWALSPKQMRALHRRVRAVGGPEIPVNFVVMGELENGEPLPPGEDEWAQWKAFVDSLRDPATEAVAFKSPAPVGGEG